MNKNAIKKFATEARLELISRVSQRALKYGISDKEVGNPNDDSVGGHLLSSTEKKQRAALIAQIKEKGYEQVMEEVAYTWFNRFSALRFMEVNGYLPSHVRVFTDEENNFKPQIISEAIHLELDGLDMEKVYAYKEANDNDELYKYLLITQCNALNSVLPGMFQKIADYTELLFPDNLLREGSVIQQMIELIPEDDWKDAVQIIGWLYQYYNSEKKDDVFAALKKNVKITKENIPAATQLFTPDWIVRYMVENSLGRLWLEGHPDVKEQLLPTEEEQSAYAAGNRDPEDTKWHYYLEEAEQEPEVQAQLAEIRKEYATLTPDQLKVIDPCSGSGHILAYMFDVLMKIYESYGYTTREAVASIVENNLYGLDIDDRAAQLAYFAVMMKARQYDRRFFSRGIQPHVYAIAESNHVDSFALDYFCNGDAKLKKAMDTIISELHDAKEYGSIITVSQQEWSALYDRFAEITEDINMSRETALRELLPLVQVAEALVQKYDAVVTNPPYMGSSGMNAKLTDFVKKNYPDSKSDLFSCFIEHSNGMIKRNRFNCMVTMQSWMFLSSFEKMREKVLRTKSITNLMHMENMVMGIAFGTAVTVFRNDYVTGYKGTYNQIKLQDIENDKPRVFPVLENRFAQTSTDSFSKIPGSPVAYWVSEKTIASFEKGILADVADTKQGFATGDNNRFLKFWQEVDWNTVGLNYSSRELAKESFKKWFPTNKGGSYRKWYGNNIYLANWKNDGSEMRAFSGSVIRNPQYYFRQGITWSSLSSGGLSMRFSPTGFIFESKGSMCYLKDECNLFYVLALMNTKVVDSMLNILAPTLDYHEGPMSKVPVVIDSNRKKLIDEKAKVCVNICKNDWDSYETSWDFVTHPFITYRSGAGFADIPMNKWQYRIADAYHTWESNATAQFDLLKKNEEELNRIFIDIYGLQDELTPEVEDKDVTVRKADLGRDIRSFISYAVGCMFGRYSLDVDGLAYAGGEWDNSKYSTFAADKDNIIPISDDEYFEDDIVGRFVKFVEIVYGKDTLDENLKFIADALGGKGQPKDVIRNYFLNDFYSDHCKIYQKRPIYWLFDSGKKNGFKALIYMHRYQPDTIARIRTDYVHEQQARYRTAIADLETRIANASTGERVKLNKQLKTLNDQATEIHEYEEKIHHLADQMISIDLDDGVKVNYAKFQDVLAKIK
ncbi:BREX-1 system adenine-specific DNA-methyltransferase PglX [[Eubacterium] siraeum]|uniref:site-specific DNA-methyltransferase (adenine-specific) n=1 Tax=[Eubacterium] siraeum TaxID=39492 RepID=A0A174ZJM3_9FIRM|nr:BREX-1 system adenine-specific DNA-methyltransferase PglX [[Eubacterium] siraeum]CUQ84428.1 Type I restriction-modification system methyltransferase subunit [[Eubacterium] siraeum]